MNVSKNQLVCARCHLVGLTSGMLLTTKSSTCNGAHSLTVWLRTASKRSVSRRPDRGCLGSTADVVMSANAKAVIPDSVSNGLNGVSGSVPAGPAQSNSGSGSQVPEIGTPQQSQSWHPISIGATRLLAGDEPGRSNRDLSLIHI